MDNYYALEGCRMHNGRMNTYIFKHISKEITITVDAYDYDQAVAILMEELK